MIPDTALSVDLLSPPEAGRVRKLRTRDQDDVPSVILALALGAFFLTRDSAAWCAVYDNDADNGDVEDWPRLLMNGGDAGEIGKMLFLLSVVPSLAVGGLFDLIRILAKKYPFVVPLFVGGLGGLALRTPLETYKKIGNSLLCAGSVLADLYRPYSEALNNFRKLAPVIPTWWELSKTIDRKSVLTRACLHALSRAPRSILSAKELADVLPPLGVGQDAQLVRETMNGNSCFARPYRGRWQVGHVF
jgi:hypothetical protein